MEKRAINPTRDIPEWKSVADAKMKQHKRRKADKAKPLKTFEQLSNPEKDELLKTVLLNAGLIAESE